jgi:hypothetical protein
VQALLAQAVAQGASHSSEDDGGSLALSLVALAAMLVPVVVLGFVGRIFWKAHKRDEEERRRTDEWRNAHSS